MRYSVFISQCYAGPHQNCRYFYRKSSAWTAIGIFCKLCVVFGIRVHRTHCKDHLELSTTFNWSCIYRCRKLWRLAIRKSIVKRDFNSIVTRYFLSWTATLFHCIQIRICNDIIHFGNATSNWSVIVLLESHLARDWYYVPRMNSL